MGVIITCHWDERERHIESEVVSESANQKINRKRYKCFRCINRSSRTK